MEKKWFLGGLLLISGILLVAMVGCDLNEPLNWENSNTTVEEVAPYLKLEYDERMVSTSYTWPSYMVESICMPKSSGGENELLTDYANTSTTFIVDDLGYVSVRKVWNEGNADIRMPMEMWESVKDLTHPIPPDQRSITSYEYSGGTFTAYAGDGSIIESFLYPIDSLKIDIDEIDMNFVQDYFNGGYQTDSTNMNVSELLNSYERNGGTHHELSSSETLVELPHSLSQDGSTIKMVLDRRSGQVNRHALYNHEGNLERMVRYSYDRSNNVAFPIQKMEFTAGRKPDGEWGLLGKTIWTRKNISLQISGMGE